MVCLAALVRILDFVHRVYLDLARTRIKSGNSDTTMTSGTPSSCDYCGLPLVRAWWGESVSGPAYCCFGCRFAAEVTRSRGEEGAANWTLTRLGLAIFLTLNVMVFTMALWTQDFYGGQETDSFASSLQGLFRYGSLLFALPVLLLLGGPLAESAWQTLRQGRLSADLLLVAGVAASYLYSVVSVIQGEGAVYFEVGCMVLVLVTLGRWLEATGKLRTTAALEALHQLLPDTVRRVEAMGEAIVPLDEIRPGDLLRVLPGERIPCDGILRSNGASVDEQVLTGESLPAEKAHGDILFGGTLNLDGNLLLEATAISEDGALARMIALVRSAREKKGHYEQLADRITSWFLPAVMLAAVAAFGVHGSHHGLDKGILVALAVLLIACPCALGLATPMAVWAALGKAAQAQVLFRDGQALERLANVKAVRFDKTGTLTDGVPSVDRCMTKSDLPRRETLELAASLASTSPHVFCDAIRIFSVGESGVDANARAVKDARTIPGCGVIARYGDAEEIVRLGSPRWLSESGLSIPDDLSSAIEAALSDGKALTCLSRADSVIAVFVMQERLRLEARQMIALLREQGYDVAVLTGDHLTRGTRLSNELSIPVEAGLLPEGKVAALEKVCRELGPVAMVGDGINDAPALIASDVGLAMGCGADLSRESAQVCLLGNDLTRLPWAMALARDTVRVIRGNLFWAFIYNAVGVGIACTGKLNPVLASLAMVLSSLFVVTNSLRLTGTDSTAVTLQKSIIKEEGSGLLKEETAR